MSGRRKESTLPPYDKEGKIPVIRSNTRTGEKVAGFKDPVSGEYDDLMLIRDSADLKLFLTRYQVGVVQIQVNPKDFRPFRSKKIIQIGPFQRGGAGAGDGDPQAG